MLEFLSNACVMAALIGAFEPCGPGASGLAQEEAGTIRVEIQGVLVPGNAEGQHPTIKAGGLEIQVVLDRGDAVIESFYGQSVLIRGMLESRRDAQGAQRLVCIVSEGPLVTAPVVEYLVGYKEGKAERVSEICKELNLIVLERYSEGSWLRVRTTPETVPDYRARLKADEAVNFVDQNLQIRTPTPPGGEQPPG